MEAIPSLTALVFAAYVIWLVVRIVNRRLRPPAAPEEPEWPGMAWGVCLIPLLAAGWILGYSGPVILVIIASGPLALDRTVWEAAIALVLSAIGTELAFSGRLRWWLRPLVWGMAIGAVCSLIYGISNGWSADLTV